MRKPVLITRPLNMTNVNSLHLKQRAFSLVEVVVALGIFASAVVVIVGLLAANTTGSNRVVEAEVAARLADNIQTELQRYGYAAVSGALANTDSASRIYLVATQDGSRVLPSKEKPDGTITMPYATAENNLATASTPGTPPGIALRDRYFHISIGRVEPDPTDPNKLTSPQSSAQANAVAAYPVVIEVTWPHRTPNGPTLGDADTFNDPRPSETSIVTPEQQRETFKLTTAIVR